MEYTYKGQEYILNLIDTQVTSIFRTVSRSIAACEGHFWCCIQANNFEFIFGARNDLEIIPVLNKVDLPSANPEEVMIL
jgi:GTP-binding protein LepA